ncbi:homoserine dehydrogenase [Desulfonatronovibrio hydrogenovorans]|uniref:homoserine dehydrogenase n=1 Tax=Desulfonatronovibrio hydrogenovorans TaxID=53245 RepID=UPI00048B96C0|nr:homoserine dehydrogenase [Desulfonatronovibrio hydrogenovorans]
MEKKVINLALAGFGTVGTGLARIIRENRDWIERRTGKDLVITRVLVRDLTKVRSFIPGPETRFTDDPRDILADPEIDIVVELMGGLDTAQELIKKSLESGKHVVTANKALLAEKGSELFALAHDLNLGLYYEASVAGGIPIIQTLKDSLAGNRIPSITGILNGTANFILSEMTAKDQDFGTALKAAQDKGYAEADPTLDIEGLDAAHKLAILIRLAHGVDYPLQKLPVQGISRVKALDIALAREFGYVIKLIAQVKEKSGYLQAGVFPALLPDDHILAKVDGPFNSVLLKGNAVGPIMLYGQGAGDLPTGSAVLSDIMALAKGNSVVDNTGFRERLLPGADLVEPDLAVSRHYFRMTAQDKPGVLSAVSGVMGEHNISIAQAVQKPGPQGGDVPIVFVTHRAQLKAVYSALKVIDEFDFITAPTVHYRIL